jgi:acetoin utilization protein AcuB
MKIKSVMTPCPYIIDYDSSFEKAQEKMKLYSIRHLPVIKGEDLVGVVSERDIDLASLISQSISIKSTVGDVCHSDPFIVDQDEDLSTVTMDMAERKLDFALVTNDEMKFVGIFTTTDACRVLHMLLEEGVLKEKD